MDFLFSYNYDWVMAAIFLVLAIFVLLPIGRPLVRFLAPHDKKRNKRELSEEEQKQYAKVLAIFFGVLFLCELAAAMVLEKYPLFSLPYFGAVMADLIWFIVALRKL